MDPIGPSKEFIIDYTVFDAIRAGFNKVLFIIRHDIEEPFKATIGRRVAQHIETAYAFQEISDLPGSIPFNPERTKPWGTVQALLSCDGMIKTPYAILNADDFYGRKSYEILSQQLDTLSADSPIGCMVGFQLDRTLSKYGSVTRGICQSDDNNRLKTIVETPGIQHEGHDVFYEDAKGKTTLLNHDALASMNMWGFSPALFDVFKQEFLAFLQKHAGELKSELVIPTTTNDLIKKGKAEIKILSTPSEWFGVTYPDDKADAMQKIKDLIKAGEYPDNLWA